jgi:hypothetical protein
MISKSTVIGRTVLMTKLRSQFLGGRRQNTAHPRVRSEPHVSRQARCPPLGLNLLGREAVQNKNSVQNRALNPYECLHFCHIVHPMKECCSSSRRLRLFLQKKHVRCSLIRRKDRVISVIVLDRNPSHAGTCPQFETEAEGSNGWLDHQCITASSTSQNRRSPR